MLQKISVEKKKIENIEEEITIWCQLNCNFLILIRKKKVSSRKVAQQQQLYERKKLAGNYLKLTDGITIRKIILNTNDSTF